MRKRKISTRAGAWVLSAAMLINGMPLNVFAENADDGIYTESVEEDSGTVESAESGDETAGSWENSETYQSDGGDTGDEAGNVEAPTGTVDGADGFTDNAAGSSEEGGNTNTSDTADNSGFTDSNQNSEEESSDSTEETADAITPHDAIFQVLWSDENDLADRRDDKDLSKRFTIYQNGQPMESQPQIVLEKEMEDGTGGTRLGTYRVQSLPDSDGSGTDYTYSIKENAPAGYEAFTADAVTDLDDGETSALLAQLVAPDQELPVSLADGDDLYRADKMFGNYLRQYTFEGSITWNDNANQQNIRPDLESWFQNHIQITCDGAAYKSFRVHYEQNADDESVWNYQIKGLFAVKEDKTQATYEVSLDAPEGYATENGVFTVNGNQKDCQTVFELVQDDNSSEDVPGANSDVMDASDAEPTEAPEETTDVEPTENPEQTEDINTDETLEESNENNFTSDDSLENLVDEFMALPQAAGAVAATTAMENKGSAKVTAAFLDKAAQSQDAYNTLVSTYGVILSYTIESKTVDLQLNYTSGKWVLANEEQSIQLAEIGLDKETLETKINSSWNWTLGTGTLNLTGLPSKVGTDSKDESSWKDVSWNLKLADEQKTGESPKREGYYAPIHNEETNIYTFIPYEKFSFTLDLREGSTPETDIAKILNQLTLSYGSEAGETISLAEIKKQFPDANIAYEYPDNSDKSKINVTINNLKWCNENKKEYVYSVLLSSPITKSADLETVKGDDTLAARYDNSQSSNFGSKTDKCYNNGIFYLTLTGNTDYKANKIWLDENHFAESGQTVKENAAGRPNATWTLWRYPKNGSDYTKASPVSVNDRQVFWYVSNETNSGETFTYTTSSAEGNNITLPVTGTDSSGNVSHESVILPKYDSDGYPYVYFIRETMTGQSNGYTQVHGKVEQTENGTTVTQTGNDPQLSARGNDSSVYYNGTLSNRITGTTSVSARKLWINAAHQDNIKNVDVVFTLQYSYDAESAETRSWNNVLNNGTAVTQTMNGFLSEIQEKSIETSVPEYDELGRKLYYRWIETDIKENGESLTTGNISRNEDGQVVSFTLNCNKGENAKDGEEHYISVSEKDANGNPVVKNCLVGTTNYFVDKLWYGWKNSDADTGKTAPDDKAEIEVVLYQNGEIYKVNGVPQTYTVKKDSYKGRDWALMINDLPKYDEKGRKYVYYAVEKNEDGTVSDTYKYNDENLKEYAVNNAVISNTKGDSDKYIRIEKKWEDDGDTHYRMPVEIGVWRTARTSDSEKEDVYLGSVTLSKDNNWWSYFTIPAKDAKTDDTYYIREIKLDDGKNQYYTHPVYGENGDTSEGTPLIQEKNLSEENSVYSEDETLKSKGGNPGLNKIVDYVDTDDYRYDVTYSIIKGNDNSNTAENGAENSSLLDMDTYCVTNHRYGWINLTVTKNWKDEGQKDRAALGAELRLEIANQSQLTGVELSENGLTVNGVSYPVYSVDLAKQTGIIQSIGSDVSEQGKEVIGFWNLPKFDKKGVKIRYKVCEYAPESTGSTTKKDVTTSATTLSAADYSTVISDSENSYTVVSGKKHALDTQKIEITNKRSGVRTVTFYKLWIDQAIIDKRPDIFFALYKAVGTKTPELYGRFEPYEVTRTADKAFYKYVFSNLPKYDENGAEITYYATEGTHVAASALEYIPVQYYYPTDTIKFNSESNGLSSGLKDTYVPANKTTCYATISYAGSDGVGKYEVTNADSSDVNVRTSATGTCVLRENGIFVNEIRNTVKVSGKKIWKNVLEGFPENQLPPLNFDLIRTDVNRTSEKVAKFANDITTNESTTEFSFEMRYLGQNSQKGEFVRTLDENDATSVLPNDTWKQLLPKYDENGNIYTYTLEEHVTGSNSETTKNLYERNIETNSFLVDNTFKDGTGSITIEKNWNDWYQNNKYSNQHPDITFNIYRFFEKVDSDEKVTGYTSPVKVASKKLKNGANPCFVTFDKLNIYAPDGRKCYYYIEEVLPNGYDAVPISLKTESEGTKQQIKLETDTEGNKFPSKGSNTSSVFTFEGSIGSSGNVQTAAGRFELTNNYKTMQDSVALYGSKIWEDIDNDFNTRPDTIQIKVYRRAAAQGTNNAIPADGESWENILENDAEITIGSTTGNCKFVPNTNKTETGTKTLNTKEVSVSWSKDESNTNKWIYTISNLDKYAPNGNPWIYKIVETPITINNNPTDSAVINYSTDSTESTQQSSSANSITMTDLTNKLETTELTVEKKWENQHSVITKSATVTVDLWVKVGSAGYVKASEYTNANTNNSNMYFAKAAADEKLKLSATITDNGIYTFTGLPKVLKTDDGIQICQYIAVESAITYNDNTVNLNPTAVNVDGGMVTVTYGTNGNNSIYDTTYTRDSATGKVTITITNSLKDANSTSISFKKVWENDSSNKFLTRPQKIRIELYRAEVSSNSSENGNEQYTQLNPRLYWNLNLDGDKISTNPGTSDWKVDESGIATLSGLPATSPDGSKTYKYKVVELGDSSYTDILETVGKDTSGKDIAVSNKNNKTRKPGYYEIAYSRGGAINNPEVITNKLVTVDLAVTKVWDNDVDENAHEFRPNTVNLTLWRCERNTDGTPNYNKAEDVTELYGTAPTWTYNINNTWTCTYSNLPKYYGVTSSANGYQGKEYYYYVKEANQPGYLDGVITEHRDQNSENANSQTLSLKNTATVFQMDKIDRDTKESIRSKALVLKLTGTGTGTTGYTAEWSRDVDGKESVVVKNGDNVIYSKKATDSASHVDIKGLPLGDYELSETEVPTGYEQITPVTITLSSANDSTTGQKLVITVNNNGQVQVVANGTVLTVSNTKTSLDIIKTDGSNNLSGAQFNLKPASGSSFVTASNNENGLTFNVNAGGIVNTETEPNPTIGELLINNTYILTETKAPDGYICPYTLNGTNRVNPTITFTLDDNGNIISSGKTRYTITGFTANDVAITQNDPDSFTIVNHPIEITLQKISSREDNVRLSGAKFVLTDNTLQTPSAGESSYKKEVLTDENGQLILSGADTNVKLIQNHSYTLEEIQAPDGYILPDNHPTVSFTVDENGTIKNVTTSPEGNITVSTTGETANKLIKVKNDPVEFSLEKQDVVKNADQSVRYLSNAVFALYKGNEADQTAVYGTDSIATLSTDGNGMLTFTTATGNSGYKLTTGVHYKLVETKAPVGYEKVSAFTFVINTNGTITYETGSGNNVDETSYNEATKTFTVKDSKTSFELDKINSEKKSAINDGDLVLTVKDKAENTVLTWRRNSQGIVIVSVEASNSYAKTIEYRDGKIHGLPVSVAGTDTEYYVLSETGTPKGYATAASVQFTMGVDGKLSYYANNTDVENNNKLELITNKTNESKLIIFDQPIRGHVTITKTLGDSNKKLQGVTFDLYKKKGTGTSAAGATSANEDILIASGLTTDENGRWTTVNNSTYFAETAGEGSDVSLSKGLPSGTYYFVETSTTDEAVLASGPVGEFTVTDTSTTATVTVNSVSITNAEFKTSLKVKKLDATTNTAITKGVTFKLEKYTLENNNVESSKIDETPVDGNGEIVFDNLQKGKYILTETSATGYEGGFKAYFEIVDSDNGKPLEVNQANADRFFKDVELSEKVASSDPSWLTETGIRNTRKKATLTVYKIGLAGLDTGDGKGLNDVEFSLRKKAENAAQADPYTEILNGLKTGNVYKYEARSTAYTPVAVKTDVGTLKITDLEWGDYKLVETKSADGYSITGAEAEFTVDQDTDFDSGVKLKVNKNNQILNYQTKLRVKKQGTDGIGLADAVFEIKGVFAGCDGEETTKTATTDSDGNLKLTGYLIAGKTYTLKETVPPAGYELLKNEVEFKVEENGTINGFSKEADKVGYKLTVSGSYDNEITVSDKPIEVHLQKFAEDGTLPLLGAKFKVTPEKADEKFADGSAEIELDMAASSEADGLDGKLIAGRSYVVEEIQAPSTPKEYVKAAPFTFKVDADGNVTIDGNTDSAKVVSKNGDAIAIIAVTDHPFATYVSLVKKDGKDNNPIEKTEFTLYKLNIDGNGYTEKNTIPTDEKGSLEFVIEESGTYKIVETRAAYGYDLARYTAEFTIDNTMEFQNKTLNLADTVNSDVKKKYNLTISGNISTSTDCIVNDRLTGEVTLTKKDVTDSGNPVGLDGITFTLYKKGIQEDGSDDKKLRDFITGNFYQKDVKGDWKESDAVVSDANSEDGQAAGTIHALGLLKISGLDWGSYYLLETKASGYKLSSEKYEFVIGKKLKDNQYSGIDVDLGTITNEKNQIQIAKAAKDATTGEYLAGAGFTLTKPDNSTESWISDEEPKVFRGLVPGTYILTETKAPAGYIISDPVTFVVKADGTITDEDNKQIENNLVIMKDTPNTLTIRKTDDLGSELSGKAMGQLKLKLEDVTTDETLKTISDTAPATTERCTAPQELTQANLTNGVWTLTGVLSGGHTYTLTETSVPDNYLIADSIVFTMGTDGVIRSVSGADSATSDSDKVTNGRINNLYLAGVSTNELQVRDTEVKATVAITKQDSELKGADQKPLPLEEIQFKFYRQNGLKPDLDEETTDTLIKKNEADKTGIWKTGADGKITIENLSEGIYYFREVKADGYIYDPNAVYPVTISRSDDKKQIVVQYGNDKKSEGILENTRNTLTVFKADDHGNLLSPESMSQVEFTITDITDGEPGNEIVKLTTATSAKYTYASENATWTLRGQLVQGHRYKLSETKTPYGYLTSEDITFVMGENGNVNLSVTDVKINGSVELTKYQANADGTAGDVLKGVTFDLYKIKGSDAAKLSELKKDPANDEKINDEPLVTDGNGKITVSNLPEGSYYFLETSAPANIFIDGATTDIATIDASQHGKTVTVEKTDDAFVTYVNVFKADNFDAQEKAGIADTEFTLYKEVETEAGTKEFKPVVSEQNPEKTDENGNVQFTITEAGTYQIRETNAAYGYKYDADEAYTATFTITNTNDFQNNVLHLANTAETSSADKEGTLKKYQLKIANALEDAGGTWKDTVTNKRLNGSVTVTKKDNTDPANVTGINRVTFELYKVNGEEETKLGEFQTGNIYTRDTKAESGWSGAEAAEDQRGLLKISGLDWGSYYLLETKASGYKLSSEKHEFVIGKKLKDNQYSGIEVDLGTITNEKNQIQIAKAAKNAATGKYLARAGFVLTGPDGFQKQAWFSTEDAKVFSGLPVGVYTLTETKAPVGYKRNTASMSFKVNADGTITDALGNIIANNLVVMEDEPTELIIQKTDEEGENLSEDALKQVELTLTDETLENALSEIDTKDPVPSSENEREKKTATITLNMDSANPYVYSADGSWKLTGVLSVGHTYKLAETSVPTNYLIAEPVVFTVGENGAIAIISGTGTENGNNLYFPATEDSAQKLQIQDTEIKATVVITKQDSEADKDGNHKKLENVEFKFYRQNSDSPDLSENTKDTLIKNGDEEIWKTNADGKITIENLSEGSYYFREVKADGYIYNPDKVYRITVGKTENNQQIAVTYGEGFKKNESGTTEPVIENTQNVLTVKKLDGNGKMLSEKSMNELELTLTDITEATEKNPGTTIVKLTTAANDKYTYDPATATWTLKGQLIQGHTYRLSETGRPYGYLIASDITFTMGENGNIQVAGGAVAEREQQSGENTGKNLYTETSLTVTDVQINGCVELTKYQANADGTAGDVLKGVTFDLYRIKGSDTAKLDKLEKDPENDEQINDEPLVTDGNGKITVSDLPEGSYYFLETSAPADVFMDGATTDIATIDAGQHGKTVTVEKADDAFVTYVNIFKADNFDGQKKAGIADTEFTLYKEAETEAGTKEFKPVVSEQNPEKTDENGNVQFIITEAGTYQIRETNAAYGYEYDDDKAYTATFTVTNTNDFQNNVLHLANTAETSSADKEGTLEKYQLKIENALSDAGDTWKDTVTNKRLTGSVTVTKKDNTNPAKVTGINGVTFELYKVNGEEETKLGEFQTGNIYTKDTDGEGGWRSAKAAEDQPGLLKISGLDWGSYYLKETVADVYQVDSTNRYEFVIGNIKNDEEKSGIDVTLDDILNVQNQLTITKIDEDGKPLGSVLDQETLSNLELTVKEVLTDKDGKTEEKDVVVLKPAASANGEYSYDPATTTWTLTGKLTQGHTYKLVETGRPEGYVTAQPITFIMGQNGKIEILGSSAEKAVEEETSADRNSTDRNSTDRNSTDKNSTDKNSADKDSVDKASTERTSVDRIADSFNVEGTTNLYTDTALAVRDIKLHADICLEKKDENGAKVQGAVFSLYKLLGEKADPKSDKLIAEGLETGEDGKTPVQTVGEGYYYFVETAAPADKVLDSTPTTPVLISEEQHGTVVTVPAVNKDFHYSVEITKKDGTDETLLDGVEFTLYEVVEADENAGTDEDAASAGSENSEKPANADAAGDAAANADSEPAGTENLVKVASGTTGSETNETGKLTFNITKAGTYEIQETGTIYGYEFNKENPYKYRFTISNTDEYQNQKLSLEVKNTRSTGTVTLTKKDGETEENLNDIIFALYYKAPGTEEYEKVLDTITGKTYTGKATESGTVWNEKAGEDGEIAVDSLPWGDYYMVETKADSYVLSDTKYEFTIGNVQDEKAHSGLSVDLGTIYNEKIRGNILLKKKDGQGNPLENAVFTLYRMKGDTADISADEKIQENLTTDKNGEILVEKLTEGRYYFAETAAPDNVFMDGSISDVAVINQSVHGKTVEVDMVNTAFQAGVQLVKTDADTDAALAGVEFTLYRKDGEAYAEVSRAETDADGKAAFTLSQAGSYKVVETIGAYGYDYDAENPYTAEFTVTNTADFQNAVLTLADSVSEAVAKKYNVKISGNLSQSTESVTNKKTPAEETGSITVTKYLQLDGMTNGLEIGTADTTFYTALFTDAEGTRRYSDVKELHIQDGTSTSVTFDGLPKGTYYVFETLADGTRIPYEELTADANGNQYYCTGIGTENISISPQQKEASAELYNWYMDLPDGYYLSGRLEITKNVIRSGETTETDDTFYAGIFDETGNLVTVAELLQNGTVTVDVKLGGADNTQPVTYTVQETDKDGNALDESFPYDIEISGSGYISRENPIGSITITNTVIEEEPEPTKTPMPTETPAPEPTEVPGNGGSDGSSGGHGSSNVKTGDDTNAQPFILLFLLSGTVLIYIGRKRRKSA